MALTPKVDHFRNGSKTEVSELARHARFTLRSRHRQPAPACPFGANKRHPGAAICNASVTMPVSPRTSLISAAVDLDLPSTRNLISDQGLRQQFLRGHESDVTNEANRSTHTIDDDYRPRHLRAITACVRRERSDQGRSATLLDCGAGFLGQFSVRRRELVHHGASHRLGSEGIWPIYAN